MFARRFCVSFFIRDADQFLAKATKQELAEEVRILAINLAQCQATYGTYLSKSTCALPRRTTCSLSWPRAWRTG
jgi:hypothetical protein